MGGKKTPQGPFDVKTGVFLVFTQWMKGVWWKMKGNRWERHFSGDLHSCSYKAVMAWILWYGRVALEHGDATDATQMTHRPGESS